MTYEIRENEQFGSREVYFNEKPEWNVLKALKELKLRWNPKKACWYGFKSEHEIINAIIGNISKENAENSMVVTGGYMGGGAVYGAKSNQALYGSDLSRAIREDIKNAGIKGCFVSCKSYTGGQSVTVTIKMQENEYKTENEYIAAYKIKGSFNWIYYKENGECVSTEQYFAMSAEEQEEIRISAARLAYKRARQGENLNQYHLDRENNIYTEKAMKKIQRINQIIGAFRYDGSNSMVDYYDTNFYYYLKTKPAISK